MIYPIRNEDGKSIGGPAWSWPNGQLVEKFLQGRSKSAEWSIYGPVYRIWSYTKPEIVISTPEDVREFYSDSQSHRKAASSNAGWYFHQLLGECMGLVNGTQWRGLRATFEPVFTPRATRVMAPDCEAEATRCIAGLFAADQADRTLHATTDLAQYPFFCAAHALYGKLEDSDREALWRLGQRRVALLRHVVQGGYHRFEWTSRFWAPDAAMELAHFKQDWTAFNEKLSRDRVKRGESPPIVAAWEQGRSSKDMSQDAILQTLDEMLFANLDVTTHALGWLVTLLADDPGIQQEVREELRSNSSTEMGKYLESKKTLLHYCLMETLRVRPPAIFSIPEMSPKDVVLGGFRVPKNTSVVVDTLAINVRNPFWGSDREKFRPRRFEDVQPVDLNHNLFTFGFGSRKCLGQHLAESCIKILVTKLLDQYTFKLSTPDGVITEAGSTKFRVQECNWVPLSDVRIDLEEAIK